MNKNNHGGHRKPGPGKKIGRPPKDGISRVRVTVNLDPVLLRQIDAMAEVKGMTRSDLVARALYDILTFDTPKKLPKGTVIFDYYPTEPSDNLADMTPEELVEEQLKTSGSFYTDAEPERQADTLSPDLLAELHAQTLANESFDPDSPPSIESIISEYQKGHLPKTVPPMPHNWPSALKQALVALNYQFKGKGLHGSQDAVKRWKKDSWSNEPLKQALLMLRNSGSMALVELITHCALDIGRKEVLAWASLDESDRIAILWHLAFTGTITPAALGDVGKRFEQALSQAAAP